jgi:hypothetical protein
MGLFEYIIFMMSLFLENILIMILVTFEGY